MESVMQGEISWKKSSMFDRKGLITQVVAFLSHCDILVKSFVILWFIVGGNNLK